VKLEKREQSSQITNKSPTRNCGVRSTRAKSSRLAKQSLRNYGDAGNRMNFHPLAVERVLDESADDAHVRVDGREVDMVSETLASGFGVGLSDGEAADNLED
jgi:hypothetical protein